MNQRPKIFVSYACVFRLAAEMVSESSDWGEEFELNGIVCQKLVYLAYSCNAIKQALRVIGVVDGSDYPANVANKFLIKYHDIHGQQYTPPDYPHKPIYSSTWFECDEEDTQQKRILALLLAAEYSGKGGVLCEKVLK